MDPGQSSLGRMDPDLWDSLPTALVNMVVAELPFLSLVRKRLVCKSWNSLVLSKRFSPRNPNPKSLLLYPFLGYHKDLDLSDAALDRKPSLIAYDIMKNEWQKLFVNCPHDILGEDIPLLRLVATSGGLLCFDFSKTSHTDQNFVVCNPVTNKWKKLPHMELHPQLPSDTSLWWGVAGLVYDADCSSYKLVVVGFHQENRNGAPEWFLKGTQVYDSVTELWTLTFQDRDLKMRRGSMDKFSTKFNTLNNRSVFWNKHLYVLAIRFFGWDPDVAIFSLEKGTWIIVSALSTQACIHACLLCLDQNALLVTCGYEEYGRTINFWKLNIGNMEAMWSPNQPNTQNLWLKVKSIKGDQLPRLHRVPMSFDNWVCVGHKKFASLLICTKTSRQPLLTVLGHDLQKDSWRPVPSSNSLEVKKFCNLCAFEPSLASV